MLELPDVMLCAVDTANVSTTIAVLNKSLSQVRFGDAALLTHEIPTGQFPFRTEIIPSLRSRAEYCRFVVTRLGAFTTRKFNLLVQWDGFVVQPSAWCPEFLKYDYIGARWPWYRDGMDVGNSGFCLRSKKLLDRISTAALAAGTPDMADDIFICRFLRPELEKDGIRFAPAQVADRFAYESGLPDRETFGFHGLFNMWRHVSDTEMVRFAAEAADYLVSDRVWAETIVIYFNLRKFPPLKAFYRRLRTEFTMEQVIHEFREFRHFLPISEPDIDQFVRTLERLV